MHMRTRNIAEILVDRIDLTDKNCSRMYVLNEIYLYMQ